MRSSNYFNDLLMHMKQLRRVIYGNVLLFLLTGCYCQQVTSSASMRRLTPAKGYSICGEHNGSGHNILVNGYYGAILSDPSTVRETYSQATLQQPNLRHYLQFGVRGERYFSPGFTPYPVLGIGLDYSFDFFSVNYQLTDSLYASKDSYQRQRVHLSFNYITLIRQRTVGYFTFQGGVLYGNRTSTYLAPEEITEKSTLHGQFSYRGGYGLSFFFDGPWGVNVEAGYGGGGYAKVGMFFWL